MIGHLPKERRREQNGWPTAEVLKLKSDLESRIRVTKCEIQNLKWRSKAYIQEDRDTLAFTLKCISWQKGARGNLAMAKRDAAEGLAKINKLQAKDYQELFPPMCQRTESECQAKNAHPGNFLEQIMNGGVQTDAHSDIGKRSPFWEGVVQGARSRQGGWRSPQDGAKVDLTQPSARRWPPTDRPPDKPPPWKGASRGGVRERAGTPYISQLASFARGSYSLSRNATPLQKMKIEVCAPSNYSASSAAGSSPSTEECVAGGTRMVAGLGLTGSPPNLGRDLVRLPRTKSAGSIAQRWVLAAPPPV
jgi:hypothetical protein